MTIEPKALNAEQAVMAIVLDEGSSIFDMPGLSPHHFSDASLSRLFAEAQSAEGSFDLQQLAQACQVSVDELVRLRMRAFDVGIGTHRARHYANEVIEAHRHRRLRAAVHSCMYEAERFEVRTIANRLIGEIESIIADDVPRKTMKELCDEWWKNYEAASENPDHVRSMFIASGLKDIDSMLDPGFACGAVHIIAAETGGGKSSMVNAIAHNAAAQGTSCSLYGFEDSSLMVAGRLLSRMTGIRLNKIRRYRGDKTLLYGGVKDLAALPIGVVDRSPQEFDRLCWNIRQDIRVNRCRLVVVDFLQILQGMKGRTEYEQINYACSQLFHIARETNVALLLVSQYSRGGELKGSSKIEQDAYTVMRLVNRKVMDSPPDIGDRGEPVPIPVIEADFVKQKNGPRGTVLLHFDAPCVTFRNADRVLKERYQRALERSRPPK